MTNPTTNDTNKPKQKQRKRPRSNDNNELELSHTIVPLAHPSPHPTNSNDSDHLHLRVLQPYVYTFTSHAKARWVGRTVLDVYCSEFPSYPADYYKSALRQGRIQVDHERVSSDLCIQSSNVLCHTVHRHEPAVAVSLPEAPFVRIVGETDTLLVVDKPPTLPVHPCGGYHQNSLVPLLERYYNGNETSKDGNDNGNSNDPQSSSSGQPQGNNKLYTIHRLDRLTSGLTILAKTRQEAQVWSAAMQQRGGNTCQKLYLARVRGRFPMQLREKETLARISSTSGGDGAAKLPIHGEWMDETSADNQLKPKKKSWAEPMDVPKARQQNACAYWITDSSPSGSSAVSDMVLNDFSRIETSVDALLESLETRRNNANKEKDEDATVTKDASIPWLHIACPVRIANPKLGVCECGIFSSLEDTVYRQTVKPAQTSIAVVSYDATSDTTLLLCLPKTGRTHQIRLHLQALGHPIANDMNYGGELFFGDPIGRAACETAKAELRKKNNDGGLNMSTDAPATASEVQAMHESEPWDETKEPLKEYIARTCLWCARANDPVLEYRVRSPGIWLHALQYALWTSPSSTTDGNDDNNNCGARELSFRTPLPGWARQNMKFGANQTEDTKGDSG